jgi:hypothetical protein
MAIVVTAVRPHAHRHWPATGVWPVAQSSQRNADAIPEVELIKIELLDSFYGPGYGISTAEAEAEAAIRCFDRVDINLETTYTAKAAAAAVKCCRDNSDKRVLYWHTYNSSDISGLMDSTKFDKIPGDLCDLTG